MDVKRHNNKRLLIRWSRVRISHRLPRFQTLSDKAGVRAGVSFPHTPAFSLYSPWPAQRLHFLDAAIVCGPELLLGVAKQLMALLARFFSIGTF